MPAQSERLELSPVTARSIYVAVEDRTNDPIRYRRIFSEPEGPTLSADEVVLPSIESPSSSLAYATIDGAREPFVLEPDSRARGLEDDWQLGSPRSCTPHSGPGIYWECCEGLHETKEAVTPPLSPGSPGYALGRAYSVWVQSPPVRPLSVDEERLVFGEGMVVVPGELRWNGEVEGCQEDVRGEVALALLALFALWWLASDITGFCW